MNDACIRRMNAADIDAILTIEQQCFSLPWSRAAFEVEMRDNDLAHYIVIEVGGLVVGYAGMWMILDEAHVTNIAVLPEYRNRGLGLKLIIALMAAAKTLGATCMTLEVRVSNETAQRLYRRLGFVVRGQRRQYYSDTREDALIMWRDEL